MKKVVLIIPIILLLMACGGKKNNPVPVVPPPTKAQLTSPTQNAVCTTGIVISDTQSSITFNWAASENTESYSLVVEDLLRSVITAQNTTQTQLNVTLLRNTPYSWYVVSKSSKTSTTSLSDTWKFYNAGPGIVTYAPFPAEILSPTFGQNVTANSGLIDLTWKGSSVTSGTIANYNVYFGTTNSPAILKSSITDSFVNNVPVTSNTTYYWRIITKDINGNTSDSGIYQFSVN